MRALPKKLSEISNYKQKLTENQIQDFANNVENIVQDLYVHGVNYPRSKDSMHPLLYDTIANLEKIAEYMRDSNNSKNIENLSKVFELLDNMLLESATYRLELYSSDKSINRRLSKSLDELRVIRSQIIKGELTSNLVDANVSNDEQEIINHAQKCANIFSSKESNFTIRKLILNLKYPNGKTFEQIAAENPGKVKFSISNKKYSIHNKRVVRLTKDRKNAIIDYNTQKQNQYIRTYLKSKQNITFEEADKNPELKSEYQEFFLENFYNNRSISNYMDDYRHLNPALITREISNKMNKLNAGERFLLSSYSNLPIEATVDFNWYVNRLTSTNNRIKLLTNYLDQYEKRIENANTAFFSELDSNMTNITQNLIKRGFAAQKDVERALQFNLISVKTLVKLTNNNTIGYYNNNSILNKNVLNACKTPGDKSTRIVYDMIKSDFFIRYKSRTEMPIRLHITEYLDRFQPNILGKTTAREYFLEYLQNKELKLASHEIAAAVKRGVKLDLRETNPEKAKRTVINILEPKPENIEIFKIALSKINPNTFMRISGRIKPENMEFILNNQITIGASAKDPILRINHFDVKSTGDNEIIKYDSNMFAKYLQNNYVNEKGQPVKESNTDAITLLEYAYKNNLKFESGNNISELQYLIKEKQKIEKQINQEKSYVQRKQLNEQLQKLDKKIKKMKKYPISLHLDSSPLGAVLLMDSKFIDAEKIAKMDIPPQAIGKFITNENSAKILQIFEYQMQADPAKGPEIMNALMSSYHNAKEYEKPIIEGIYAKFQTVVRGGVKVDPKEQESAIKFIDTIAEYMATHPLSMRIAIDQATKGQSVVHGTHAEQLSQEQIASAIRMLPLEKIDEHFSTISAIMDKGKSHDKQMDTNAFQKFIMNFCALIQSICMGTKKSVASFEKFIEGREDLKLVEESPKASIYGVGSTEIALKSDTPNVPIANLKAAVKTLNTNVSTEVIEAGKDAIAGIEAGAELLRI